MVKTNSAPPTDNTDFDLPGTCIENRGMECPLTGTRAVTDWLMVPARGLAVFPVSTSVDILEKFTGFSQGHEYRRSDSARIRQDGGTAQG
jgi:hypothetical protein